MAAIAGLRGTGNWGTDERPKNFRELILWRDPNGSAPLTALMSKMKKESTDDPEFAWWEEELTIVRLTLGTVTTTTHTTLAVTAGDATNLKAGDMLLIEEATESGTYADEVVEVTTTPTATTQVVVERAVAGTATAIANGDYATLVGSAYGEGESSPDAVSRNPSKKYNYTQIFKDAYELSGTAEQTNLRTGDPLKNDKKRKMFDHSTRMEMAALFGKRFEDATGGASKSKPMRGTRGLLEALADEVSTYSHCINIWSTAVTVDTFLDAVYPVFDYGTPSASTAGSERLAIGGNAALNALNKMARDDGQIQFDGVVKVYGMNLRRYILPQGELYFRTHPLMNVHGRYKKGLFIIDPSGMVYRPMRNRDTKPMDNIQDNDADLRKGQWMTEAGFEFHHLATMSFQGNVT